MSLRTLELILNKEQIVSGRCVPVHNAAYLSAHLRDQTSEKRLISPTRNEQETLTLAHFVLKPMFSTMM